MAGEKRQVSRDGASVIRWRADGKEIYYVSSDDWLTAVAIEGPGLQRIAPARRLFHVNLPPRSLTSAGPNVGLDVSADGKRFLVPEHGAAGPSPFVVIVNWPELMRARTR
jgi:Tol biopolymer transport system component